MVDFCQLKSDLLRLVAQGAEKRQEVGRPVLISHVIETSIVPLAFFQKAVDENVSNIVYWSNSSQDRILAGYGSAYEIKVTTAKGPRFAQVEMAWQQISAGSIASGVPNIPGTGPLLLGGGSFDPLRPQSQKWRHFAFAEFHIPEWLITENQGQRWLTINVLLTGTENLEALTERLLASGEKFLRHDQFVGAEMAPLFVAEQSPDSWLKQVTELADAVRNGKMEKVVLSRELLAAAQKDFSAAQILHNLHEKQKNSYIFAFVHEGDCFLGASPERLIKGEQGIYYSTCLAGSSARGQTPEEDDVLGAELLADPKNCLEHDLVVKMIVAKLQKYCTALTVPKAPVLMKLKNIQHLYTPLMGKARTGTSLLQLIDDLHPTPALGGVPQQFAVELIRETEKFDRGWYGGPIGWIDGKGDGEFNVALRCGLLQGKQVSLFAGGGIVADSDPVSEYEETRVKFRPMLFALGGK